MRAAAAQASAENVRECVRYPFERLWIDSGRRNRLRDWPIRERRFILHGTHPNFGPQR
jgi:hypothetical protein